VRVPWRRMVTSSMGPPLVKSPWHGSPPAWNR
jgi:hypothetical protein